TRAERRKILQQGEAINRMVLVMQSRPLLRPFSSLLPRALDISSQQRIGVYDCLYVALAEREQCRVVTADQRVLTLFPAHDLARFLALAPARGVDHIGEPQRVDGWPQYGGKNGAVSRLRALLPNTSEG
ncbi:MAG: type II toxin-antitoxin system VapC family toxin, partial [Pirellulales bacterium]